MGVSNEDRLFVRVDGSYPAPTSSGFAEIAGDDSPGKPILSPISLNLHSSKGTRDARTRQRHERHTATEQRERRKQLTNLCGDVLPSAAAWNLGAPARVAILAICSEQTLDGEPTQHLGLDAVPKTGLRLGVVAHVIVALARYPCEATVIKFHVIRVTVEIAFGRFGQTLRQPRTVKESTHLRVQFARARIEIVGADKADPAIEGECLRVQTRAARST